MPSPTALGPTSPVSSFPVEDQLVGTPTLDHNGCVTGRAAAKPMIGARQRRLCLCSCSPLPASCATKTAYPASHTHNTLACNHTSLPPPPPPHPCTAPHSHLYFGYKLTVTARTTGLAPNVAKDRAPPHPRTPWQSIQKSRRSYLIFHLDSNKQHFFSKSLGCTPLLPSPKSVHLWGVHRHCIGWRLVGVPFQSTLQTV